MGFYIISDQPFWPQETFPTVGRICCDGDGHLRAASVLVEGCSEPGRNNCVSLDLSHLKSFSIFPGQVMT